MISVCIATYNGEDFIRQQIESILPQIGPDDEIVISDDGSTDRTVSILLSLDDPRIRIFRNVRRRGVNGNFENALLRCCGSVIFLADQDDVWEEGKIRECCEELQNHDCVVHDCYVTDKELNVLSSSLFKSLKSGKGFFRNLRRNGYSGGCMCFTEEVLYEILPFPSSTRYFYDQWIGLRLEMCRKSILFHKRPLMKFRRHDASCSTSGKRSEKSLISRLLYRLILLKDLILFDLIQY